MLLSPTFPRLSEFPYYEKTTIIAPSEIDAVIVFCSKHPNIVVEHIEENPPRAFDFFPEYVGEGT